MQGARAVRAHMKAAGVDEIDQQRPTAIPGQGYSLARTILQSEISQRSPEHRLATAEGGILVQAESLGGASLVSQWCTFPGGGGVDRNGNGEITKSIKISAHRFTKTAIDKIEKAAKAMPLRKVGRPQDVAHAVVFLASSKAGHVTGQVLSVSGGYSMIG